MLCKICVYISFAASERVFKCVVILFGFGEKRHFLFRVYIYYAQNNQTPKKTSARGELI